MSNVIYTSYGWGTGEGGHGHFENRDWTIIQREKINEYCCRNKIDLKVIDSGNKYMHEILSKIEPDKDINSKNHSVYTLSAIAAILDFCESNHDLFYWLHLDMAVARMDVNVFDTFKIPNDSLYCWSWDDFYLDRTWDQKKFIMRNALASSVGLKIDNNYPPKKCNASVFILTKDTAIKLKDVVFTSVNFLKNPPDQNIGFIEETVIEVVEAAKKDITVVGLCDYYFDENVINNNCRPIEFCKEYGYKTEDKDYYNNSVFLHFWGENKKYIPAFYESKI